MDGVADGHVHRHAGQGDRLLHARAEGAAGDLAFQAGGRDHFLVRAQDAAFFAQDQADELRALALGLQGRLADEVALRDQVDRPGQAGVERVHGVVHVLAVQVHAGFQAQRIARTETGRLDADGDKGIPQRFGLRGRHADLEAVFAGVAGAGDHRFAKRRIGNDDGVERLEVFRWRLGGRQHLPHLGAGVRALHGDQRDRIVAVAARGDRHAAVGGGVLLIHPGDVFFGGAGVDDDAEPFFGQEIDDQVVDDAAFGIEHARVQGLARHLQLVDVIGQEATQERAHVGALDVDDAHMGHVEHAGVAAHRVVLFDLRTVVDGHVPAAEIDHLGVGGAVSGIERGRFERHGILRQK